MTWAEDLTVFASERLPNRAREALWDRGVSDEQISLYRIGHLDRELPEGLPDRFLKWSEGKLNDVYVLPLTTALGEVKGFQFRHVDRSKPGYMDYFVDRREACLFGLGQAIESMWATRSVYLVEGAFDLFPVQRATPMVVATLTAHANNATVRLLRRVVQRVWLGYDMDPPGRRGCVQFTEKHGNEFKVYTVEYPKVNGELIKDPGDLWEAWGDTQLVPFIHSVLNQDLFA